MLKTNEPVHFSLSNANLIFSRQSGIQENTFCIRANSAKLLEAESLHTLSNHISLFNKIKSRH